MHKRFARILFQTILAIFIVIPTVASSSHTSVQAETITGVSQIVSASQANDEGNNSSYLSSMSSRVISADGHYVAFWSYASNLISGDTNGVADVFVKDMDTWAVERVSVSYNGGQGTGNSKYVSLSGDGRFVAFNSAAANLIPDGIQTIEVFDQSSGQYASRFVTTHNDTNGQEDIFVHDRVKGTTEIISISTGGVQANNQSHSPSISADGRYVAFVSLASNLVSWDTNGTADLFRYDRLTGETIRISLGSGNNQINYVGGYEMSADGKHVTFISQSSDIVGGDTNGIRDVFVRDIETGITQIVSVSTSGAQIQKQGIYEVLVALPRISADGRYVVFQSEANNLVVYDTNNSQDIFVRDTLKGTTVRVSISNTGIEGNNDSFHPTISSDGNFISFLSSADNLTSGDSNGLTDVFVYHLQYGITKSSVTWDGSQAMNDGLNGASEASISPNGDWVVFETWANNMISHGTNGFSHIYRSNVVGFEGGLVARPPVILVHGWQGLNTTNGGYYCNMGIQQYDKTNSTLMPSTDLVGYEGIADWLYADGYDVWIAHLESNPLHTHTLEKNAKCLRGQIETVWEKNPLPITIIAHSMGGLVSRAAIRTLPDKVDIAKLFTLGSPHAGIPFEIIMAGYPAIVHNICSPSNLLISQPAVCQMTPTYTSYIFNDSNPNLPTSKVKYYFFGGDGGEGIMNFLLKESGQGENDGLVGQYSALGWTPKGVFQPTGWSGNNFANQYYTKETHPAQSDASKAYYVAPSGQQSESYMCISELMKELSDSSNCVSLKAQSLPDTMNDYSPSPLPKFTEIYAGHLVAGETVILPMISDSSSITKFYLTWVGDNAPSFTLTRPDSQVVDPEYTMSHPTEVSYETSAGSPESAPSATYTFFSGQIGTWLSTIIATDSIDYKIIGLIDSSISLDAQTDLFAYQIGNIATITAKVQSAGVGLDGATVVATVSRPDKAAEVVTLTGQGDGTYSNIYNIQDTPGYFVIDIKATGTHNSISFSREQSLNLVVAPNDLQLTGNYAEQPRDDDLDGDFDFLDFSMEVNSANSGEYLVTADLYAGEQLISQRGEYFTIPAGLQIITLQFAGREINESGLNGPYTVRNLSFTPIEIGITAASGENVWTTNAYSYSQFSDETSPQVNSIRLADLNPTNTVSAGFIVEFSEPVVGVDEKDFALTTSGVTEASINAVIDAGNHNSYLVSTSTGIGNGTIRLDVMDNDSIKDISDNILGGSGIGNGNFTSGETYSIIKTVTISGKVGITNAQLSYQDGIPKSVTADGGGNYSIEVPYDWSGTVTPSKPGYVFTPSNKTYTNVSSSVTNENYTAIATATFGDVTTSYWAWQWIERLYSVGITGGCTLTPLNYCPSNPVTRAQMAIFLLRAEHGSDYVPPAATGIFEDVPAASSTAPWIEQLYNEGITGGCSTIPLRYCPNNPVNRAQMAIFLLRAEHGSDYTPSAATGIFTDVPADSFTAPFIEQLSNEGITGGCSLTPLMYCPAKTVTRDQMAIFLVRTFNLP